MATIRIGLAGLTLAVTAALATPAAAEFFGCNGTDRPGRVLYTYAGAPSAYGVRHARVHHTHVLAARSHARRTQVTHVTYDASKRYWHERSRW